MLSSHDSVHLLGEAMMYHIKIKVSILISFIFRPKLLAASDLKMEHTAGSVAFAQWFCLFGDLSFPFLNCLPPP